MTLVHQDSAGHPGTLIQTDVPLAVFIILVRSWRSSNEGVYLAMDPNAGVPNSHT